MLNTFLRTRLSLFNLAIIRHDACGSQASNTFENIEKYSLGLQNYDSGCKAIYVIFIYFLYRISMFEYKKIIICHIRNVLPCLLLIIEFNFQQKGRSSISSVPHKLFVWRLSLRPNPKRSINYVLKWIYTYIYILKYYLIF